MLMGIIARGTAFVFRHYDAIHDNMQAVYNKIFVGSSIVTPLFLGIIAGSTVSGRIDPQANDFATAYIFSWLNLFSVSTGLFTVALCGFLAAVYLIGEADDENDRRRFILKAKITNLLAIACGALVFLAARLEGVPLYRWIILDPVGLMAVILASASLVVLWRSINRRRPAVLRVLVAFQVSMILVAITYAHFPDIVILADGSQVSLIDTQAPAKTMEALGWALLVGSIFILPALYYLFYSFQKGEDFAH
jgi:cytochrome d ubiquinol oxidase subunit II